MSWKIIYGSPNEDTWSRYLRNPFHSSQLDLWWRLATENIHWERQLSSRGCAWFVSEGCSCKYKYSGTTWQPTVWPDWLQSITNAVMRIVGPTARIKTKPNSCNVNLYANGLDSVGWHSDDEKLFQTKTTKSLIVSLSLGATRLFQIKHNKKYNIRVLDFSVY